MKIFLLVMLWFVTVALAFGAGVLVTPHQKSVPQASEAPSPLPPPTWWRLPEELREELANRCTPEAISRVLPDRNIVQPYTISPSTSRDTRLTMCMIYPGK